METAIAINSPSSEQIDCTNYMTEVENSGEITISDFSEMDVFVEYADPTDTKVAIRLQYVSASPSANQWTISSISPHTRDPNEWNGGEKATIDFVLDPVMKDKSSVTRLL